MFTGISNDIKVLFVAAQRVIPFSIIHPLPPLSTLNVLHEPKAFKNIKSWY